MYVIKKDNGEVIEFDRIVDVEKWIRDNGLFPEDNVSMYGLRNTILDQGRVCLYEMDNPDSDWIVADIIIK